MRADLFIVHRSDGLLRALVAMLVQEATASTARRASRPWSPASGWRRARPCSSSTRTRRAPGPDWRERLERVLADVPRVVLTWRPRASYPAGVTPLGKPFDARELLDTLSRNVARAGLRHPAAR